MAKTIAFVDNFDEVELFLKSFKPSIDKETICIAGDALAFAALKNKGIECRALDDYRNRKEYQEAEINAVELAGKWFIDDDGNDLTEFQGISLASCMKKDIYQFFRYVYKTIQDVTNIIKQENPKKVLLMGNYQIPESVYGKDNLLLHRQVFFLLMKDNEYEIETCEVSTHIVSPKRDNLFKQIRFQKYSIFSGRLVYFCPTILNSLLKKIVIFLVDGIKSFFSKGKNANDPIRALTFSASDLAFFGNDFIESFTKNKNGYLYYLEDENNCFFSLKIFRTSKKKFSSLINNKRKKEFLSHLKPWFKNIIEREKHSPKWVFKDLSLVYVLEKYLNWLVEEKIPALIITLWSIENTIKKYNINIVLVSERWGDKRTILTQVARNNKLFVLHMPHSLEVGFMDGDKIIAPQNLDINKISFHPTHELSSFKYQQQMQKKRGLSEDRLFLTGIPRYGKFKPKSREELYNARKRLGLSPDEEVAFIHIRGIIRHYYDKIILSEQFSTFELLNFYESFFKQIANRNNYRAVFKLKMSDINDWLINNIITRNGMNNISIFKNHLHDLLIASDAVVVAHSNIGIEAIYYDTPVIVYNKLDKPSLLPLCAEKAAIEINSPEEIVPILDRLKNDESYREERLNSQRNFLKRNLPADNLAPCHRVTDVISQLAKKI